MYTPNSGKSERGRECNAVQPARDRHARWPNIPDYLCARKTPCKVPNNSGGGGGGGEAANGHRLAEFENGDYRRSFGPIGDARFALPGTRACARPPTAVIPRSVLGRGDAHARREDPPLHDTNFQLRQAAPTSSSRRRITIARTPARPRVSRTRPRGDCSWCSAL